MQDIKEGAAKGSSDKEYVDIDGRTYIITTIPAMPAQRIMVEAFSAIARGDFASIPEETVMKLLSYAGAVNANGGEVMFQNENIVNQMVPDQLTLLDIESRMIEKNFGFFSSGRLKEILERVTKIAQASQG